MSPSDWTFVGGIACGILIAASSAVLGVIIGREVKRARLRRCTGVAAVWCPEHGDCTCPMTEGGWRDMNDSSCPLHSAESSHAGAPT